MFFITKAFVVAKNIIESFIDTVLGFIFWMWIFIIMYEITGRVQTYFNKLNRPIVPPVKIEPINKTFCCTCGKKTSVEKKRDVGVGVSADIDNVPELKEDGGDEVQVVEPPTKESTMIDMVFVE